MDITKLHPSIKKEVEALNFENNDFSVEKQLSILRASYDEALARLDYLEEAYCLVRSTTIGLRHFIQHKCKFDPEEYWELNEQIKASGFYE